MSRRQESGGSSGSSHSGGRRHDAVRSKAAAYVGEKVGGESLLGERRGRRRPRASALWAFVANTASVGAVHWETGLQGTTFWDCNGAACDAKVLHPFEEDLYLYAPQYAPADPEQLGGNAYGEKLWLTGAASDDLTETMGQGTNCCGDGKGCGRCLLVRNPTAVNADWTAVVMKKSRCPPESKGCSAGLKHIDLAVPGFELLSESTANVCGSSGRKDTFITADQASLCSGWALNATDTSGCNCAALPNATLEQQMLRRGCEVFAEWGWTSGDPQLEFLHVECPKAWASRVGDGFTSSGVKTLESPDYTWWIVIAVVVVCVCIFIGLINFMVDRREAKKRYAEMEKRKLRQRQKKRAQSSSRGSTSSSQSGVSSEGESEQSESEPVRP